MTVWRHAISWSKFRLALECPLQLQYTIDKRPHGKATTNYYAELGKLTQKVFELYYNQKINLKEGGRSERTIEKILDRILTSRIFKDLEITYPHHKTEKDLIEAVRLHTMNGFRVMEKMGMTKLEYKSELKWNSVFRGFRMFALIDFFREGRTACSIFDGKGHAEKNADIRQIQYYALAVAASGKMIGNAGLIYWQHGYEPVDVTPAALKTFIDGDFAKGKPFFDDLKEGVSYEMEATPSISVCQYCNWRDVCEHSATKDRKPPMREDLPPEVGFGEI